MVANEAFSRVKIGNQLRDVDWPLTDGRSVRFEYPLADETGAYYALCGRRGQALAVLEAMRASRALGEGEAQALASAAALSTPFVFLANGEEVRFRDLDRDAHVRPVATIFGQDELERQFAPRSPSFVARAMYAAPGWFRPT
jgi:type I restriction enzyme, R subunit